MRRLLWRLFPTYLVFIVICTGAIGLYAWRASRSFFISQTERHLAVQGGLIGRQLRLDGATASQPDFDSQVRELSAACECRVTLIGTDGSVLAESHRDAEGLLNHAARPEVRQALSGQAGSSLRYSSSLGEEMLYVALPVESGGRVVGVLRVARPLTRIKQELAAIYLRISVAAVAVIVLAALLALWASRMLSRPLEEIKAGAERFARGELGHRLYVPRTEEVGALAKSLNQMAGQLDEKIRTITQQKARQEAILASMDEGIIAVDNQCRVLSMNDAVRKLTAGPLAGRAADQVGRSLAEVVRHAQLERLAESVLAGGGPGEAEMSVRMDGADRAILVHATPLRDPHDRGIGALLVLNDVTRLRRLERVRQDFVANVSHELKTPITSIKGFVETLREGPVDATQAKRFLDIVAAQADRLGAIIEDLLTLSRLEQDPEKASIQTKVLPVEPVLRQAADACHLAVENGQVRVRIDCPPGLAIRMNGPLMEQAVANLLDNAIKYSEPGQTVHISAERCPGGGVLIRVRDQGVGIPAEHLPRLFERFYRVDKARSRKLGGTGLGLAIVKHIVNVHGGSTSVTSAPGAGSTFSIHLAADPGGGEPSQEIIPGRAVKSD